MYFVVYTVTRRMPYIVMLTFEGDPALKASSITVQLLHLHLVMQEEPTPPATKDVVAEAAAAAAARDEEEGLQGAAARAAARAASLGLAAASEGYASLGGVDDHVSCMSLMRCNRSMICLPKSKLPGCQYKTRLPSLDSSSREQYSSICMTGTSRQLYCSGYTTAACICSA